MNGAQRARRQVIAAAAEVIGVAEIAVINAWFELSSCNDDGQAPFRGRVSIHYPPAEDQSSSVEEIAAFLKRLAAHGWHPNPQFHSATAHTEKNGVTTMFQSQGAGERVRVITVLGQCLDTDTASPPEPCDLEPTGHDLLPIRPVIDSPTKR